VSNLENKARELENKLDGFGKERHTEESGSDTISVEDQMSTIEKELENIKQYVVKQEEWEKRIEKCHKNRIL